eukprot:TRINITY_DN1886_c0_g1_i1.p3 TRINITY_DN1886_c0_g1~~TRINITY_DN1886_c0_g1_i1.p3  ORF type:complete len:248 (+),score=149.48 TRINITY_DN1886_c0_g1_i1:75-818(+)
MGKVKPAAAKKPVKTAVTAESAKNPLFVSRPKDFGVGNDIPPKRDVSRFVRWPKYIIRQRQKRVLERRLKVPPSLNLFRSTLDKQTKAELFKLLAKYKPETDKERTERLTKDAAAKKADAKATASKKRAMVKFGIQQVTRMIEEKRAKLVVIAHDVDPIEIVVWLPALCKAQGIPYCIVKGKAALGRLVGMKTTTCLCLDAVNNEDNSTFAKMTDACNSGFNSTYDEKKKHWGGCEMGRKGRTARAL